MIVIGILGGVGSGKSFVAAALAEQGAKVLDADRIGHEVLRDADVQQAIRDRWGDSVFDDEGNVDRPALGKIVFAPAPDGPRELAELERMAHPRIGQRLQSRLEELRKAETAVVVLDAAVMLKAGWDRYCDKIVFVDAPREVRLARARQRGWSESEFSSRESAQQSVEYKRGRADFIVDNAGSPDRTKKQVQQLCRSLDARSPSFNSTSNNCAAPPSEVPTPKGSEC